MKASAWIVMGVLLAGAGCKKGNEDLKKKVTAVRDRAVACKDARCAAAATEEYVSLTKDLSGLSDADAQFFADMGTEIRTIEVRLEAAH